MEPVIRQNVDVSNPHMGRAWIYVGLDLGERVWVAGILDLRSCEYRSRKFDEGDVWRDCVSWLVELKNRSACQMHVLYEAGRQGFELARQLRDLGIDTDIVAISRFEKNGRKRGKSDRLDAKSLAYLDWTVRKFPLVWVPTREQEGARNLLMWERTLKQSLKRNRSRSLSILARWGVRYKRRASLACHRRLLDSIPRNTLGVVDQQRVESLYREEMSLRDELSKIKPMIVERLNSDPIAQKLMRYRGIGGGLARALSWYVGNWKRFPNGKSFAAYCGLTSVHARSGNSDSDLGVSHAGHPVLRCAFSQLTLLWLCWQPESELAIRTKERITNGKAGRLARTALARQLAVALWKWIMHDVLIPGAHFSDGGSSND